MTRPVSHTGRKAFDAEEVGDSEAFVLIETSGGNKEHDEEVIASCNGNLAPGALKLYKSRNYKAYWRLYIRLLTELHRLSPREYYLSPRNSSTSCGRLGNYFRKLHLKQVKCTNTT